MVDPPRLGTRRSPDPFTERAYRSGPWRTALTITDRRRLPSVRRVAMSSSWARPTASISSGVQVVIAAFLVVIRPGRKSVDAASSVCASKPAIRLRRVARVLSSACEPRTMRSGAGSTSTLSMIRAAIRAGSPGARPFFGSSIRRNACAGVSS